jgi:hypothetical protein
VRAERVDASRDLLSVLADERALLDERHHLLHGLVDFMNHRVRAGA